jgi:hypothetical protein
MAFASTLSSSWPSTGSGYSRSWKTIFAFAQELRRARDSWHGCPPALCSVVGRDSAGSRLRHDGAQALGNMLRAEASPGDPARQGVTGEGRSVPAPAVGSARREDLPPCRPFRSRGRRPSGRRTSATSRTWPACRQGPSPRSCTRAPVSPTRPATGSWPPSTSSATVRTSWCGHLRAAHLHGRPAHLGQLRALQRPRHGRGRGCARRGPTVGDHVRQPRGQRAGGPALSTLAGRRIDGLIVTGRCSNPRPPLSGPLAFPVVYAHTPSTDPADCSIVGG